MTNPRSMSRRQFGTAVAALSGVALLPSRLFGANAPRNRLRLAPLGCGRVARDHDMPGVLKSGRADIVAVCDPDARRAADANLLLPTLYKEIGAAAPPVSVHRDYRELLAHEDIAAVVVRAPDHWHAQIALAAGRAGKDISQQKPFPITGA